MAHFALVEDGIVMNVIVAEQEVIDSGLFGEPSNWIQTSYNTKGGIHYDPETNQPDGGIPLRKNYAVIGGVYDTEKDAFYEQQPYPSWILDEETCKWKAPIPYPDVSHTKKYFWDEANLEWYLAFDTETGEYTIRPNSW
jgi:hypothetical protein